MCGRAPFVTGRTKLCLEVYPQMPSAPTGTARKSESGLAGVPVLPTAAEAVAVATAYAESEADGVIERDRAGSARPPAAELARLDSSGLLSITVPRACGGP